jgi:drug/metabolite transporter (DMT)-like permease
LIGINAYHPRGGTRILRGRESHAIHGPPSADIACFVAHAGLGFSGRAWLSLVGLGLVFHLLAWLLNSWGLGHVDTAFGVLGLQGQQVATLFLAAWLLAEPIRPFGLVGSNIFVEVLNTMGWNTYLA